jgi:hypothetical protein
MLIADWNGLAFLRELLFAERFNEAAIFLGSCQVKTPSSRSKAKLCLATYPDQFLFTVIFFTLFYIGQQEGLDLEYDLALRFLNLSFWPRFLN